MWETWVQSLGWEDPLEKGMATHSSILAWRIPPPVVGGPEEPVGLRKPCRIQQTVGGGALGQRTRLQGQPISLPSSPLGVGGSGQGFRGWRVLWVTRDTRMQLFPAVSRAAGRVERAECASDRPSQGPSSECSAFQG